MLCEEKNASHQSSKKKNHLEWLCCVKLSWKLRVEIIRVGNLLICCENWHSLGYFKHWPLALVAVIRNLPSEQTSSLLILFVLIFLLFLFLILLFSSCRVYCNNKSSGNSRRRNRSSYIASVISSSISIIFFCSLTSALRMASAIDI